MYLISSQSFHFPQRTGAWSWVFLVIPLFTLFDTDNRVSREELRQRVKMRTWSSSILEEAWLRASAVFVGHTM